VLLWAGWQRYRGSIKSDGKIYFWSPNLQARSGAHLASYTGSFFLWRAKWPNREASRLPPSSAEVEN
jgi:hypothetical protein